MSTYKNTFCTIMQIRKNLSPAGLKKYLLALILNSLCHPTVFYMRSQKWSHLDNSP